MTDLTDYAEKALNDWLMGGATPTRPTARNVALYTTLPGEDGTGGVEVSTGTWTNYARQAATFGAAASGTGLCSNSADIDFGTATTTGDVTLVGFGIFDHAGNLLIRKAFASNQIVQNGNPVKFAAAALTFAIA